MRRRYTSVMRDAGSDATLERGTKALAADTDILLAISFGSVPQGRAGFESDIDVGVWLASGQIGPDHRAGLIRTIAAAPGRPVVGG